MPKLNPRKRRPALGALVSAALLLTTLALPFSALAQKEAPATISGRVTDGERGLPGVSVALIYGEPPQRFRVAARAKTDADGRFILTNVAPGRYQILPAAPAYVVEGLGINYPPGRPLNIVAGEEVKDVDFKMEVGGVITGRVTDADGNPVVAEMVMVTDAEETPRPPRFNFDPRDMVTDDRGVYRLFGLPPGRYRVSVGSAGDSGTLSFGRRKIFRRTFYPDAIEQTQARIVEVKSGIEATDVDINVGRALKTYKVTGRFVTADTNQPVAGVPVGFGTVSAGGRGTGRYNNGTTTDARGEFLTEGLAPGRYVVHVSSVSQSQPQQQATEFYSDPVFFEVTDADVSGLLVKLKRGATVSGVVSIEGVADRAAAAQMLSAVRVLPFLEVRQQQQQLAPSSPVRFIKVNPDGTFRLTGLQPGKLRLMASNDSVKGLQLTRVELNNTNVISGLELNEGAQLAGVQMVLTYGTATLIGQTTFLNGAPPPNARLMAFARIISPTPGPTATRSAEVDARGYFRIEGISAGEYEVIVNVFDFTPRPGGVGGRPRPLRSEPLRVVIGEGGETKIAPVIDFK